MREILLHDNTSLDFKRKDMKIIEKLYKNNRELICSKHIRYIVKVLGSIDDTSNLDEVFIKQLSLKKDSKKQVYIKREFLEKKKLSRFTWKTTGCMYIIRDKNLLKIKYEHDINIKICFLPSFKNSLPLN